MGETRLSFKRYEKKYLLSREQYEKLFRALEDHIEPDPSFRSVRRRRRRGSRSWV